MGEHPRRIKLIEQPAVLDMMAILAAASFGNMQHKKSKEKLVKPLIAKRPAGRNDSCPCGSGKKYKKCCLSKSK